MGDGGAGCGICFAATCYTTYVLLLLCLCLVGWQAAVAVTAVLCDICMYVCRLLPYIHMFVLPFGVEQTVCERVGLAGVGELRGVRMGRGNGDARSIDTNGHLKWMMGEGTNEGWGVQYVVLYVCIECSTEYGILSWWWLWQW